MTDIEKIFADASKNAHEHWVEAPKKFEEWVRFEHSKIEDPKYRSYSIFASLFDISSF